MSYPFRSKPHCWEKDPPLSSKTPLLGEDPTPFVQTTLLGEGPNPFRWKPHCWEKGLPLSLKTPLLGESISCSKPHCWKKDPPLSFKTPLLGEGPALSVMFALFLYCLVSGVFEENITIFKLKIVLLVGTFKEINFFCSIFSTQNRAVRWWKWIAQFSEDPCNAKTLEKLFLLQKVC